MSLQEDLNNKKEELQSSIQDKKNEISETIGSGVKKTKRFTKRLLLFTFLAALLIGAGYMFWCNMTYSDGTRTGTLMKISKKGYVFKTMEGELNMGGFNNEDNTQVFGNTWQFSTADHKLYDELVQKQGTKMMLYYKEKNRAWPWQGETDYFVYKIEDK